MNEPISNFFDALKTGDRQSIDAFLQNDSSLASARDVTGLSAVMTALYYMQPEIADLLIDRGAQVDLFEAAASGRTDHLLSLLEQDPSAVNAWASDGFQPLGLACFFGHTAAVDLLLERGAAVNTPSKNTMRVQPLNSAVAGQHLEIARLLLEHGADPNARQGEDFTPLHGCSKWPGGDDPPAAGIRRQSKRSKHCRETPTRLRPRRSSR